MSSDAMAGLIGVILGALLAGGFEWIRKRCALVGRRRGVSALLYMEVKRLALAVRSHGWASLADSPTGSDAIIQAEPLPTTAYQAHSSELATVFSPELAVSIANFYDRVGAMNMLFGTRWQPSTIRKYAKNVLDEAGGIEPCLKKFAPKKISELAQQFTARLSKLSTRS